MKDLLDDLVRDLLEKKTRDQIAKELWEYSKQSKFPNFHKDGSGKIQPPNDKNKDKWI